MPAFTPARPARATRRRPRRWLFGLAAVALLGYAVGNLDNTDPVVTPADTVAVAPTASAPPEAPAPTTEPAATTSAAPASEAPEPSASPTTPAPTKEPADAPEVVEAEPAVVAAPGTALAVLADLEVKGRAATTGYDRDLFQYRSYDLDRNGCDVRNDILRRDLTDLVIKHDTRGCVALSGTLHSPYSGETIAFVRDSTGGAIEIDHVVALSDAWQKGAQAWDEDTLRTFGNDPLNLLAVEGRLNSQKGAGDTATWLPPHKPYRCAYVARQVAVKHEYGLWVTEAEHDAMERILTDCPDEPLPEAEYAELRPELAAAPPAPAPEPQPEPVAAPPATAPAPVMDPGPGDGGGATDQRHRTCKAAKAAGLGPYYQGKDPEYDWYRDADSDGIVCE
ncbi:GmrSD restriction endonuclease domain-containing protein [Ornithinimicrobium cavernae]|uniref:GmrSD restriction endonuclease domain-containing protein n=1 Tax=Ornithinimicrobium cavernae TaxID=2666047 RepID=UPI001F278585|nr:DUF1524 domain-containing protein [Ornithinimicrobium cavernae]